MFTDQKPWTVTAEDTKRHWGGGFWCKLCGHKFKVGDTARWVYANGTPDMTMGNFMVCQQCDGPDILTKAKVDFDAGFKAARRWGLIER